MYYFTKALFFLSQEEKHKKFKTIIASIEANIRRGMLLSDSLERFPGVFNQLYIM